GTHSKWVDLRGSRIVAFRTAMTGELFALLRHQSILAAGVGAPLVEDGPAFVDGVTDARESASAGGLSRLFGIRAAMLSGVLASDAVPARLSGLLIGEEIRMMVATGTFDVSRPLWLVGDAALCSRYRVALEVFGMASVLAADAAAHGLWMIAARAGLLGAPDAPEPAPRGAA
ncbi:MAG TPA: 2-dehydro-3-deoxygalactonokinase, partial [Luteimonas sp.]|nr:2-dehydro-3-deoxygalactonokinase [Luteimonas sp.]